MGGIIFLLTHRTEGKYFDSNGIIIHYTDEGQGTPVILLHGFAVNADLNWRLPGIIRNLKQDFRVISLDLRGHGLSSKPHEVSQYGLEMVGDVVRLMDHLQLKKAHIVGYSLGGMITLKFASLYPERVISIALLGVGWERPDNSAFLKALPQIEKSLSEGKGIKPLSSHLGDDRPKPGFLHTWSVKILTRYFNDNLALLGVVKGLGEITLTEEELKNLSMPILLIVGNRDPMKQGALELAKLVNHARLIVLEGADHITLARRKETVAALRSFLLKN